jgi:hypothetical protein
MFSIRNKSFFASSFQDFLFFSLELCSAVVLVSFVAWYYQLIGLSMLVSERAYSPPMLFRSKSASLRCIDGNMVCLIGIAHLG